MVIYQIYPRSFGETLAGITAKLDYLETLGVETLWISPFFKSPMKDFGYDVSGYTEIDPMFGTMADFDELLKAANQRGLSLMIDMVLSHSSDQHPWFQESRRDRANPKADWYVWADQAKDGVTPNNWMSLFGGSAWKWDELRKQYYLHNFLESQPDLNFHQPAVRQELLSACEFWLNKGVKGFRLDVCNFYFHSAGLENNPLKSGSDRKTDGVHAENPYNHQWHRFDKDQQENLGFLRALRALADRYPGTTLMGEIVSDDSLKIMQDYIARGQPLHTAYNFSLFRDSFDGLKLAEILSEVECALPGGTPSWALGNHDVPRFVSRFQGDSGWPQSAKCFLFFLFCLRGNVILYQGDELGLAEAEIPFEQMKDPFGIEFYPKFKGRDGCRTPMPWTDARPSSPTWLPIPDSHLERSVETQSADRESVLSFTRSMIRFRKENAWLQDAPLRVAYADAHVIVIERKKPDGSTFTAAINGSGETRKFSVGSVERELPGFGFQELPHLG